MVRTLGHPGRDEAIKTDGGPTDRILVLIPLTTMMRRIHCNTERPDRETREIRLRHHGLHRAIGP